MQAVGGGSRNSIQAVGFGAVGVGGHREESGASGEWDNGRSLGQ